MERIVDVVRAYATGDPGSLAVVIPKDARVQTGSAGFTVKPLLEKMPRLQKRELRTLLPHRFVNQSTPIGKAKVGRPDSQHEFRRNVTEPLF